jgi:hypothetical protein
MTLWLVRSGRRGEGESYALTNSVVGIGFAEFGDLSKTRSLEDIRLPRSNNGSVDSPKNPSAATTNPATTSHFGKTPVLAT